MFNITNLSEDSIWKWLKRVIIFLPLIVTSLFIILLLIGQWPRYWEWIAKEQTPFTWYQSVLLLLVAVFSIWNAVFSLLSKMKQHALTWVLVSLAFFALTIDERFAIHERIRDKLLRPADISIPFLPWVGAGDFILLLYLAIALLLFRQVMQIFKEDSLSFKFFIIGFVLSAIAILADSYNFEGMAIEALIMEQTLEEIIEAFSFSCILIATLLITHLFLKLNWLSKELRLHEKND
jgi:hypothetical protein